MCRSVSCIVVVILAVAPRLPATGLPGEAMQLPRSRSGLPIVAVKVGTKTLRLVIDTGTSRTLVSGMAAARLGLVPARRLSFGCVAGAQPTGALCAAPAPEIRLGSLSIPLDCLGWMPDEPQLAGAEDVDGVLGADALAYVDLWIDLRGARVNARFAPPGSLGPWTDGRRLTLEVVGQRLAVDAELTGIGSNRTARLVLDSGSDGLLLFGPLAHAARSRWAIGRSRAVFRPPPPVDSLPSSRSLLFAWEDRAFRSAPPGFSPRWWIGQRTACCL